MARTSWTTRSLAALALSAFALSLSSLPGRSEPTTVEIAYLPLMGIAPLFVMDQQGWTREAGLDLKLTKFSSGPAIIQALGSGKFDGVYMAVSPVLVAKAAGVDLKVVAASGRESHAFLAAGPLAGTFKEAASPKAAFAAFAKANGRPAKIASLPRGSMPDTLLRYYMEQNGLTAEDVQILSQGEEQVRQTMLAGAADGALMPEPIITILEQKMPAAKVIADGKALMAGHPGFVLALRSSFIDRNPDAALKLAALNTRAAAFILANPDQAADAIFAFFGKGLIDKDVMVAALKSPYNPPLERLSDIVSGSKDLQDYLLKIGSQTKPVDIDALFYAPALAQGGGAK
ncbi:ABC transporter substrate-binding protein [Xanthobacter sp. KR7-225]|uniref:ABC transporter substrate-binding protein n=1 Tax=Xanthobacter sp. KR7-225 TaxID=3156613 RepID=UPI0032B41FEB